MAAVDEDGELNSRRAPVVEEGVDRRPHGAPGEEHVVDEDDRATVRIEVEMGAVHDRLRPRLAARDVVAIEGDVEVAERHLGAGELADQRVQAAGEDGAARVDAYDRHGVVAGVLFDDLVRDPDECPAQVVTIEDNPLGLSLHLRAPSWSLGPG